MDNYVIDQVDWYDGMDLKQDIKLRFQTIAEFLQENGLARKNLVGRKTIIAGDFCIRTSDLTDEGRDFMKKYYTKWVRSIDRGKQASDVKILDKGLNAMRQP